MGQQPWCEAVLSSVAGATECRLFWGSSDRSATLPMLVFFTYDEWGYHFITTQALCEVAEGNAPQFARDLTQQAFGKQPKEIALNMIHPGGARMIQDIGGKLGLKDTLSAKLAWRSMNKLGNVASATVTDMIAMAWDELHVGDEAIVIGMGPGFVLDGACFRMISEKDVDVIRHKSMAGGRAVSPLT